MIITERGSEYEFPIFISSTVYNLVDLRAELERYLFELGYKPILSSSEGFHDNSPDLPPWESCLEVLETCNIMVLILDSKYGDKLDWKSYENIIGKTKVSATHAEYLYAQKKRKRILVFVREELNSIYQVYRKAYEQNKKDVDKAMKQVKDILPKGLDVDSLEFYRQVKTTHPLLWIRPFKDVTDIKKEIKKKMLNELAITFLLKQEHLQTVINVFSRKIDSLPDEERKEVLQKLSITKELQDAIEQKSSENEKLMRDLEKVKTELANSKKAKKPKEEIKKKQQSIQDIMSRIESNRTVNANLISGSTAYTVDGISLGNPINLTGNTTLNLSSNLTSGSGIASLLGCNKCGTITYGLLQRCHGCNRQLCVSCFSDILSSVGIGSGVCSDCAKKGIKVTLGSSKL